MAFTELDPRFDVFSQFARRCLVDADRRTIYQALVDRPGVGWQVETLAATVGLRVDIVRDAISMFEAAGVVASQGEEESRSYVWRSDVVYLFGESELPVDPVCQMSVVEDSTYRARDREGHERVFCSATCLETFRAAMDRMDGRTGPPTDPDR